MSPATELAEHHLVALVDRFYGKVRLDPVLGPVFNPAVHDWEEHQRTLVSFWSSIMLGTRSYRGNPMAKHRGHPIHAEHFEHWLALWRETADEVLAPEHARLVCGHAARIGQSLRYGLGLNDGTRGLGLPVIGGAGR